MRTIEWRGTLTALSSIAHAGKETGTMAGFRRETIIRPDGTRLPGVPVISGGVVRGSMRRIAAAMAQTALVGPEGRLPFSAVHALRTGGALRETRSAEEVLTGERQAMLRDMVPMLSLFGLSTAGRIVSGRLEVDKPLPVARETLHLAEHYQVDLDGYHPPSIWELVQQEAYTRHADVNTMGAQALIDAAAEGVKELPKSGGTMRWSAETLPAGTRLFHSVILTEATPVEVSFADELMTRWATRGRVGAHKGRGLGRISADYTRTCLDVLGDPAAEEVGAQWREETAAHRDDILTILSSL